jgi:hypothetical protein
VRMRKPLMLLPLVFLAAGCDFSSQPAAAGATPGAPRSGGTGGAPTSKGGSSGAPGPAASGGAPAVDAGAQGGSGGTDGDAAPTSPDAATADGAATGADVPPPVSSPDAPAADTAPSESPYPPGPYGFKVGNVMANVALTDRAGATVTLQQLRTQPGVRVLLWSSGAEWCPACKGEVRKLKSLHDQKSAQGLLILESLHQSFDFKPANAAALTRWDQMFQVNYLLTFEKSPPYEPRVNNPVVWLMDARSMKILSRETHAEGDVVAAVNAALAATK